MQLLKSARPYVAAGAAIAAITGLLAPLLGESHLVNVALCFLLLTLLVAARWGYIAGLFTAIVADLTLNFFFVPPLHRFTVQEPVNLASLGLFLAVATVGAFMLSRLREQAGRARQKEAETAILLEATRQVTHAQTPRHALDRLCEVIAHAARARGCSVLTGERFVIAGSTMDEASGRVVSRDEAAVAREALRTRLPARFVPNLPGSRPLTFVTVAGKTSAVLRLIGEISSDIPQSAIFQALANETATALERARLAREAERAAVLERADEFKSVLLSSVSHDLRSPLTAIKAAASSLRDPNIAWSDDDRAAFLLTIDTQTDRLTSTVSGLLEMSRLEGGGVRPTLEPIEAAPLLEEVALATAEATRGRKVLRCAPPGTWLRADYSLIVQALVNLVENASKYSTPGGDIRLVAEATAGRTQFSVHDTGPGIVEADLPHVFEKFYRAGSAGNTKGTGLGLALVKAMVELCGGSVSVSSSPAGTSFNISLPAAVAPQ